MIELINILLCSVFIRIKYKYVSADIRIDFDNDYYYLRHLDNKILNGRLESKIEYV